MKDQIHTSSITGALTALVGGIIIGALCFDPLFVETTGFSGHRWGWFLEVLDIFGNQVFLGLLKMLVLPLVLLSIISSVMMGRDNLRKIGIRAGIYYLLTMLMAVGLGIILVLAIQPGSSLTGKISAGLLGTTAAEIIPNSPQEGLLRRFVSMLIPNNIFAVLARGEILPAIVFSLLVGIALSALGEAAKPIKVLVNSLSDLFMKLVLVSLKLTIPGIFALVCVAVAKVGLSAFSSGMAGYMLTVISGLAIHGIILLPLLLYLFTRTNPFSFFLMMRPALITAFATSSSSATLPVSINSLSKDHEVNPEVSSLVVPLGATINMDGTALYEAVAVVFLSQCFGIELGLTEIIIVAFTATLAAIGAASIPSAGLVTMVIVISAVNDSLLAQNPNAQSIPLAGIGLLLGVDRFLDMLRTTVNVWGDLVGAKIVSRSLIKHL